MLYGGRWNSKGAPVAYASDTLALSALEYLVHADVRRLATAKLVACAASWQDDVRSEDADAARISEAWRETPAPSALAMFGDAWVREARTAILRVPSAIVPREHNVLINPRHPDADRLMFAVPEPFAFDARLLGRA
jgi:RES domain-containing protein